MTATDRLEEFRAKFDALAYRYRLCPYHDHGHGPAAAELMTAMRERYEYLPEVSKPAVIMKAFCADDDHGLNISALSGADLDLLIELCDRLAITKGKRWTTQFELRAAKGTPK